MFERPLVLMGVALALAAGVFAYLWLAGSETEPAPTRAVADSAASPEPTQAAAVPAAALPAARAAAPASPEAAARTAPRAQVDRKRAEIRERLQPAAVDDARSAPEPPPEPPKLDKEYIRESVRELIPVIRECYENALQDDPALGGKLVMKFEILGDEEVGGVVDQVEVDAEQSTIGDADMRECMRESMYTLELPPPDAGGSVFVTYPFVFEAD
jgi:hypothetical protein